jgi:hypothetical protein
LAARLDDSIRLVDMTRLRFAQRLADPAYQPSAAEFVAMARLELQIESRDFRKLGGDSVSDELKDALRRLPRYWQERIVMGAITGASMDEIVQLERSFEEQLDSDDEGPSDNSPGGSYGRSRTQMMADGR